MSFKRKSKFGGYMIGDRSYQVIGLSGKAQSGKDYIYSHYLNPNGWFQVSLAWHFKADLIGKGVITFDEAFKTKPPHVRTMLQMVGTELGRNVYGQKVWCNTLKAWMDMFSYHWGVHKFVIPDIRFVNELEMLEDFNGLKIRIKAPERSASSILDTTQRAHPSEAEMDTIIDDAFDVIIHNDPKDEATVEDQLIRGLEDNGYEY